MNVREVSESIRAATDRFEDTSADLVSITLEVDLAPPPPDGASVAFDEAEQVDRGFGVAKVIAAEGPGRVQAIRRAAETVRIERLAPPDAPPLRWWGGFGFEDQVGAGWMPLKPARFVIPEVWWHRDAERTFLTLTWNPEEDPPDWKAPVDLEGADVEESSTGSVDLPGPDGESDGDEANLDLVDSGVDAYLQAVPRVVEALRSHQVRKVVLSRAVAYRWTGTAAELFDRAEPEPGHHARFLFHAGATALVGVTPERLVRVDRHAGGKRSGRLWSEALAGSAPLSEAEARLSGEKEREEHRLVVEGVVENLRSLGLAPESGPTEIRRLNRIAHLRTPIAAEVPTGLHVLDAVEVLHPTAATAGEPRQAALEVIASAEAAPRGWYCGAVGWFDLLGAGDFRVALRSLKLSPGTLTLYVGGGWVHGSMPEAEFEETALKERAVRAAFGLEVAHAG